MPKGYEKIRDKLAKKMPMKEAKTHAAKIWNATHKANPVTRKHKEKAYD